MLSVDKAIVFGRFVAIFGKNMAPIVQNLRKIKKNCQNPLSAILRLKKVPMTTKLEGALVVGPLKGDLFCVSLMYEEELNC